jgi:RimJ/RimL family protein N-acetyltransferase
MDLLPFPEIVTARSRLRRFVPTDLPSFVAYRSDPYVAALQSWDGFTIADGERFLRELAATPLGKPGSWMQIAVAERETDALLGDCALHFIDSEQCEIGFTFARSQQGKGYAHEAVSALLVRLFKEWQRHRVIAIVDVRNTAAIRLLQRLQFRQEAHFQQHVRFKGAWCDELQFAQLRTEWNDLHGSAEPGT